MPFLSHSIPWASLASNFEYRPAQSRIPGPQAADIYPKKRSTQSKQMIHFARKFQAVVEEHSKILRARLKPAAEYKVRASTWRTPSSDSEEGDISTTPNSELKTPSVVERSRALRSQHALLRRGWRTEEETRLVLPPELCSKNDPFRNLRLIDIFELRTLETWTNPVKTPPGEDDYIEWCHERARADIIKLLIIDASLYDNDDHLDTLLLLAHHPDIDLEEYMYTSLWCCNIGCGIESLIEHALSFFIHFNVLEALIDAGEKRLLEPRTGIDLRSSKRLMRKLTSAHEYMSETVPFRMLCKMEKRFNSDGNEEEVLETDLLADKTRLASLMKWTWKIMLMADMLMREVEAPINWPWLVLNSTYEAFLTTMSWREFERDYFDRLGDGEG